MGNITIETDCPCDPGTGQGDPHYVTFDKYHLEFNGKCSYVLAETCKDSPYYLKVISKHGEVVNTLSNPDARRIESADITTNNHKINLADDGQITIDGIVVNSYYLSDEGEIGIQMIDNITSIVFSDKGKWWVEWTKNIRNKRNILYIGIHKDSDLIGKMCGMLGPKLPSNAPSQSFIGYQMKNGKYTYDVIELGNSYVVPNSCP
nr:PREDICTED: zonadhesin-like [Saccoglossus kowalevskii]